MLSGDLMWWLTAIDLPTLTGLFWLIWRTRRDHDAALQRLRDTVDTRHAQLREALAAFKLEAAKSYASIADMKEIETRLVRHLLRIETKLDATAMKTEALHAGRRGASS